MKKLILFVVLSLWQMSVVEASSSGEFAYRNPKDTLVKVQISKDVNVGGICNNSESDCQCYFYKSESDKNPKVSNITSISDAFNFVSCELPGGSTAYDLVRIVGGSFATTILPVKTELSLNQIMGQNDLKKIRKIFSYSCDRTFFEGEGVRANYIACLNNQKLGVISAKYNYYLFSSQRENNLAEKTLDIAYDTAICGNNNFLKISCSASPLDLRYGLYEESSGPFNVQIAYTAKPEGTTSVHTTGFAALPDSNGACPIGLVKTQPWLAEPKSQMPRSIPGQSLPTNFINHGALNNTLVDLSDSAPAPMLVLKASNKKPCSESGDCSNIDFKRPKIAQKAEYSALTPTICVIPKELLGGI